MLPVIGAALTGLVSKIPDILDRVLPGDSEDIKLKKLDLQQQLTNAFLQSDVIQTEVNKVEASHESLFVSGWRPAIGWICAFAFAYTYGFGPLVDAYLINKGMLPLPDLNTKELSTVLMGMLGMGSLRTLEKWVSNK